MQYLDAQTHAELFWFFAEQDRQEEPALNGVLVCLGALRSQGQHDIDEEVLRDLETRHDQRSFVLKPARKTVHEGNCLKLHHREE